MELPESLTTSQPYVSTAASLISGCVGGTMQVLVGQPLDTIKTRAQIAPPGTFTGPMDVARRTLAKEGFLGFYKVSKRLVSPYPDLTVVQTALAGSMAGAVNSVLASPVEMFKIRMQAQYGKSNDLREVVRLMWQEWGFRQGIMRGFWVTVVREIPAYAGFYTGFEVSKRAFQKRYGSEQILPVWTLLCSGAMGGIGYWTCCYPLDVIKSRVQMAEQPPRGNYIADTWRTICKEEGARALFRGLAPTYTHTTASNLSDSSLKFIFNPSYDNSVPAAASTFVGYELTMEFLHKHTNI
ncbi:hypothetical protein PSTT_01878 [Puccinia striiformis]|uniref:Uncharacterized protein n=1 Tax=Puccinia striiformis TaxID=27350 RepID=A0A2S4W1H2_9BASI|nr:hypothetical protein PSTT_05076 [Puccinia striiformis]POW15616.1 hypothetical protein PSTT_01878 [Puccinia striiformis]